MTRLSTMLVLLAVVALSAACRPEPREEIQYAEREDAIIIQLVSLQPGADELTRRLAVPEFTLYGDGTLIYQASDGEGTRLHSASLSPETIRNLLDPIVDEGFMNFTYEQSSLRSARTGPRTFVYAHTLDRANAVTIQVEGAPASNVDEEQFEVVRRIVADLRELAAIQAPEPYVPETGLMLGRTLDEPIEVTERVLQSTEWPSVLGGYGRTPADSLERLFGPAAAQLEQQPDVEIYFAPLLPYYENFPEFELP